MLRLIGLTAVMILVSHSVTAGEAPDTLEKIRRSESITIAFSDSSLPFSYLEDGAPAGYSVDLCREIVDSLTDQLGLRKLRIQWRAANTPQRLEMVENGEADIECGTSTVTLDRQERVDFSNEIFVESAGVLVRADSNIGGLVGLAGKKVAVIPSTTTQSRLAAALERKKASAEMVVISNAVEGFEALKSGKVDAYAGDRLVLIGQLATAADPTRYEMLVEEFSIDPYAFALPRGDSDFRLAVNRVLAEVYRGPVIEQIFRRAFGPNAEPSGLLRVVYLLNAYPD